MNFVKVCLSALKIYLSFMKSFLYTFSYYYSLLKIKIRDSGFLYFFYKWLIRLLTYVPVIYYTLLFLYWNYQYHSIAGAYDIHSFTNLVDLIYYYSRYGYLDAFIPQHAEDCNISEQSLQRFVEGIEGRGEVYVPFDDALHAPGVFVSLDSGEPQVDELLELVQLEVQPFLTEELLGNRVSSDTATPDPRSQPISLSNIQDLNPIERTVALTEEELFRFEVTETATSVTPDNIVTNWDKRVLTSIPNAFTVYLPILFSVKYAEHYEMVYNDLSLVFRVLEIGIPSLLLFDWVKPVFWIIFYFLYDFWEGYRFIVKNELEFIWLLEMAEYMYQPGDGGFALVYAEFIEPYLYWPLKAQLLYSLLSLILNEVLNPRGIIISLINFELGSSSFLIEKISENSVFANFSGTLDYVQDVLSFFLGLVYGVLFLGVVLLLNLFSFSFDYIAYSAAAFASGNEYMRNFFSLSLLVDCLWYLLDDHFEVALDTAEIWLLPAVVVGFLFFASSSFVSVVLVVFFSMSVILCFFFLRISGIVQYVGLNQQRLRGKFEKLHYLDPYQDLEILYTERYKIKHFVEHAEFNSTAGFTVKRRDMENKTVLCALDQALDEDHDVPIAGAIQEWAHYLGVFVYLVLGSFLLKMSFHMYPYMFNASEYFRYYSSWGSLERIGEYSGGIDKINQILYDDVLYGYRDSLGHVTVVQDIEFFDDHLYFFIQENGFLPLQEYAFPILNFNVNYSAYLIDTYYMVFSCVLFLFFLIFATSPAAPTNVVALELHQTGYNWLVFFSGFIAIIADSTDGTFITAVLDQFVEWWYVRLDDDEAPLWESTGYHDFETLYLIETLDRFPYIYQAGGGDVVGTVFAKNTRNINKGFPVARIHMLKKSVTNLRNNLPPQRSSYFYTGLDWFRDLNWYLRIFSNDFRSHLFDKYFNGTAAVNPKDVLSSLPRKAIRLGYRLERETSYRLRFRPVKIYRVIGKGIPPVVKPKILPGPLLPYIQEIPQEGESFMRKLQRVRLLQIRAAKRKHNSMSMHQLNNKKRFMIYQNDPKNPERMKKRNKKLF